MRKTKEIPKNWKMRSFSDCLETIRFFGIKKTDYQSSGQYPVVDQGQEAVSGFTDNVDFVRKDERPVIIFGDHTRVLKFVDFPAVFGNDGIKILTAKQGIDPRFIFYVLSIFSIPATGYNRHFKYLEAGKFLIPDKIDEQKKIAEILGVVDEEIEKTDQLISTAEKLKKGLMQQLLTRGIGHTKFKKTKLGLISDEWEIAKFSDIASLRSEKMDPKNGINQKYVGLEHIDQGSGLLLGFGDSTSTQSLKAIFKTGDILFGKLRPYLRKFWHAKFDGVCTTEVLVFIPKEAGDGNFVYQLVQTDEFIENSHSKSFGTKMPRTDWGIIADFQFPLPSVEERKKIGHILSAVDDKINASKQLKEKLTTLKKGLMQDLLGGMVRVNV